MNEVLTRLLKLSEADASLRTLEGQLADLAREVEHLNARLAAEDEAFRKRQEEHRALRLSALAKSGEADDTDAKIRLYQHKLEHDIIPYKEMEYLREQVAYLRGRLEELSDEALRLMAETDLDEEKLKADAADHAARRRRLEEELVAVERKQERVRAERDALRGHREALVQAVPSHFRASYERLLSAGGSAVVPVVGGTCGGCRLRLAETTLEKVKADREVVTCEHCLRFLYWRPS